MKLQITDDFNLQKIADSGQCFRWWPQETGGYKIPYRDKCLIIRRITDSEYELSCDEEEYKNTWVHYLDMETDYSKVRSLIPRDRDPFLFEASEAQMGIRILNQDLWETLISFIISQNRNIPAIKRSIELLCKACGDRMTAPDGESYYSFPDAGRIATLTPEQLDACRLGYRSRYIHDTAAGVADGTIDLAVFDKLNDDECMDRLLSITGVGKKVASCVLLFGLHRIDAFPIDVWIKRILENEYKDGYPMEDYRPYNGIYQQYMFAYYRQA